MVEREQVRPLAPAGNLPSSDDDVAALHVKKLRRRKCIKCCGCIAAVLVIQAVVIVILIFTVFRIKDPIINLKGVTITKLELVNNNTMPKPGTNMSLIADVSVKNPNVASFRYSNTTTTLYYYGTVVGEARGPPGRARARRTMRMNITVDIITDRLLASPYLNSDVGSKVLTMSSYSRIPGKVKMLEIIRKHVTVKMNCTMTVNLTTQAMQSIKCKRKVNL